MTFQTAVRLDQGFGAIGEFSHTGPRRAQPGILNSTDPSNNVIGRWFTRSADGTFAAGGTGKDGGILTSPKAYASGGTATGGTLAPTLTLRNGEAGEFAFMGEINIALTAAAAIGQGAAYVTATGEIVPLPTGTLPGTLTAIPGAVFSRVAQPAAEGGPAIIRLTA
jgi:hypothetical protein